MIWYRAYLGGDGLPIRLVTTGTDKNRIAEEAQRVADMLTQKVTIKASRDIGTAVLLEYEEIHPQKIF